jgi:hypothetical protein
VRCTAILAFSLERDVLHHQVQSCERQIDEPARHPRLVEQLVPMSRVLLRWASCEDPAGSQLLRVRGAIW